MLTSLELSWKQHKFQLNKYEGVCYRPDLQAELAAPRLRAHTLEAERAQPKRGTGCGAQGSPHTAKRHRTAPASPTRPVPTPPWATTHSSIFPRYLLGVGQVSPSLSVTAAPPSPAAGRGSRRRAEQRLAAPPAPAEVSAAAGLPGGSGRYQHRGLRRVLLPALLLGTLRREGGLVFPVIN